MKFYVWYMPKADQLFICTASEGHEPVVKMRYGWVYIGEL